MGLHAAGNRSLAAAWMLLQLLALTGFACVKNSVVGDVSEEVLLQNETRSQEAFRSGVYKYSIPARRGEFIHVQVQSENIVGEVKLLGPSSSAPLYWVTLGEAEQVGLSHVAEKSGVHVLEVTCYSEQGGRFSVWREDDHASLPVQKAMAEAALQFSQAEALRRQWTEDGLRRAIPKLQTAAKQWLDLGNSQEAAHALLRLGDVYEGLGLLQQALASFEESLAIRPAQAASPAVNAINRAAYVALLVGQGDKAAGYIEQALRSARDSNNLFAEAQALNNRGDLNYFSGDGEAALHDFDRALELCARFGAVSCEAKSRMNKGISMIDFHQDEQARVLLEEAGRQFRSVQDIRSELQALAGLGVIYLKQGKLQEALNRLNRGMELSQRIGDRQIMARVANSKGEVFRNLNDLDAALEYYQAGRDYYHALGILAGEGNSLIQIGRVQFLKENWPKALEAFESAAGKYRQTDERMLAIALGEIGNVHAQRGEVGQALDYYHQALKIKIAHSDFREAAFTLNDLGLVHLREGDAEAAKEWFRQALDRGRQAEDLYGESWTLYNLARVESATGNLAQAKSNIERSLKITERLRTSVAGLEFRASFSASVHKRYEFYVDLLMRLNRQTGLAAYAADAFQASERARSRALLDSLVAARSSLQEGITPALLDRERKLADEISLKAARRDRLAAESEQARQLDQEIRRLNHQLREAKGQIRNQSPRFAELKEPEPIELARLQREILDGDTLLLEFFLGEEQSYLWAVTDDAFESHALPGKSALEAMALKLRRRLTSLETLIQHRRTVDGDRELRSRIEEMSWLLLGRLSVGLFEKKRLVLVSDGALSQLPFAILAAPMGAGESTSKPLVQQHEIVYLPSASVATLLRNRRTLGGPKTVAVLGDPVYAARDLPGSNSGKAAAEGNRSLRRSLRESGFEGQLRRLRWSGREASWIESIAPRGASLVVLGTDANRDFVLSGQLARYQILHFAAHGLANDLHPELSGIVLSTVDSRGKARDGFLRVHDVYRLDLPADMIVLSSCSSALGPNRSGEGLASLVHSFFYAGAKRVVASLWDVDDEATAELMKRFYAQIFEKGLRPAEALRQAQLSLSQKEKWNHPFFWAAFVIQGDWKASGL